MRRFRGNVLVASSRGVQMLAYLDATFASSGSTSPTIAHTAATCPSRSCAPACLRIASSCSMASVTHFSAISPVEYTVEAYQAGGGREHAFAGELSTEWPHLAVDTGCGLHSG